MKTGVHAVTTVPWHHLAAFPAGTPSPDLRLPAHAICHEERGRLQLWRTTKSHLRAEQKKPLRRRREEVRERRTKPECGDTGLEGRKHSERATRAPTPHPCRLTSCSGPNELGKVRAKWL